MIDTIIEWTGDRFGLPMVYLVATFMMAGLLLSIIAVAAVGLACPPLGVLIGIFCLFLIIRNR